MQEIKVKAVAKINLGLTVKEKREDGYHNIETIFYPLNDIYDTLIFEKNSSDNYESDSSLPFDENNLIFRAKKILEDFVGNKLPVKIKLIKKIPVGAGLGGGSSDAASTLLALNKLFNLKIDKKKLYEFALQLGSDVPFFIYGKPAFAELRGEKLTAVNMKIKGYVVLIYPGIHISTSIAFKRTKGLKINKLLLDEILSSINNNFNNAYIYIRNDFEKYVFFKYPLIGGLYLDLYNGGALFSRMTGTGSTLYGIFEDENKAKKFCESFRNKNEKFKVLISYNHG